MIRDKDKQQQDIAELSRDTKNAHQALENNFGKGKIRAEMEAKGELNGLSDAQINAKIEQSDQHKRLMNSTASGASSGVTARR